MRRAVRFEKGPVAVGAGVMNHNNELFPRTRLPQNEYLFIKGSNLFDI